MAILGMLSWPTQVDPSYGTSTPTTMLNSKIGFLLVLVIQDSRR
jgi:hypothetical protein